MTEEKLARKMLAKVFKDESEKVDLWLKTKNPHLGNVPPSQLFEMGRGHKVLSFIKGAMEENQRD